MTLLISIVQPPSLLAIQFQPLQNNRFKRNNPAISARARTVRARAAELPAGVVVPREQPKLSEPFLGFTKTAEVWNSRACMIGLIGVFIVELVLSKGVLQTIGLEVGKGLDLPL
ncbi:light-harvesting complex-like protein OHP1, chloroplastic [Oryza sativa Japonica Group]|uniref:Os12g0480100 protein n=5 Tax=Oryza TaxID=4527 RepID=A3CHB3_ORYSJ|nr:light-harvesting complex-like protein OHP1, chloroplastic [Oryza sativa Japonica Group]EAY83105.1 hypothetical protein OsI_38322 [Oryza sativa Indica Group]KAB8117492.1 hypothetical protein EE612_059569 [Oryza sativa]ABA98252.1 one helix protein, putative, expressed [Oryza sativa Japonica Group]EAZ20476.1 hypothetical protein OsJ_36086 [Oryza sativa Japonica Group]BAF29787.1 Os12g0480100 [Oryza sativa Japonica Group]|eukprot:NP_001066768.1 Os12g0480100 [Oryza sativa Japonica Group]